MIKVCRHKWKSNSGLGGKPNFKLNQQMSPIPVMHIKCLECNDRTWVTEEQWLKQIEDRL